MIKKKLIKMMKDNKVYIAPTGAICLNDVVDNIICSKNTNQFMKNINGKTQVNNYYFIGPYTCIEMFKNSKFTRCRNIYKQILTDEEEEIVHYELRYELTTKYRLELANQLPAIKNASNKIETLNTIVDNYKLSEETKQLELQFKLSDNYKFEMEKEKLLYQKEIRIKEIESDTEIAIKNIDVDLQREKNIHLAMEKGYDLSHFSYNATKNKQNTKKKCNIVDL